jgi:cytochrome c-type biogenesis protein CcmH/NrfF
MVSTRRPVTLLFSLMLVLPLGAANSGAQENWGYELADELMSPYCPGRALSECPSPQAGELRSWILNQEQAGRSRQDVEAELYGVWGDQLLQAPRAEGVGLLAYVIPAAAFALGGAGVLWFIRRQRAGREGGPARADPTPGSTPVDALPGGVEAEIERQIDEEMGRTPTS